MDPITVSTAIDVPRDAVFDYLADIANHAEFTDHYLVDWRLTRTDSVGKGAGARFKVKAPGNRFNWVGMTFVEAQRPYRLVEVGRGGKANRIRMVGVYELVPLSGGGTRLTFTFETEPATLSDRMMESFGGRFWLKRQNQRAMQRLRTILETGESRGLRVTVAGG